MKRLPDYLKRNIGSIDEVKNIRSLIKEFNLNTVCDEARCPNKTECFKNNTATFMILGKNCSRNCKFCNIHNGSPESVNENEPDNIALAVKKLNLKYCVITSVTRDDLSDQGANQFIRTINSIKTQSNNSTKIEILTPDFQGNETLITDILDSSPDVFNHNIETVPALYPKVRPQAIFERSIKVLNFAKTNFDIITKTGIMIGFGESLDELKYVFGILANINCDILTIGQYIPPSKKHIPVKKFYTPDEFVFLHNLAISSGIKKVISAPLARSSYQAFEAFLSVKNMYNKPS